MNKIKPFILFSTPRSGSSPVYHLLADYLKNNEGIRGVEEILNPRFGRYEEGGDGLWYNKESEFNPSAESEIFTKRFSLVQKYHGKIFFKIFPSALREESTRWLLTNFTFITHERLDWKEQVLSFLVSMATEKWYDLKESPPEAGSLTASWDAFKNIESILFHFEHLKRIVKPAITISYEEFLREGPENLLATKGLINAVPGPFKNPTQKQNAGSKLEYFMNKNEIIKWLNDSPLGAIRALPK